MESIGLQKPERPYLQAIPALRANVKQLLILMVRAYQAALGPLLGGACKFHPSCSQYAVEAIERHGAGRGALLAARRLWRCRPFVAGGFDPVPEETPDVETGAASSAPTGGIELPLGRVR